MSGSALALVHDARLVEVLALCLAASSCTGERELINPTPACTAPPANECVDNDATFRTYAGQGTYNAGLGACEYAHHDRACPGCVVACLRPCEGVICPPLADGCLSGRCDAAQGGLCIYANSPDDSACELTGPPGVCRSGECLRVCDTVDDCEDFNLCTDDSCDEFVCRHAFNSGDCGVCASCLGGECTYDPSQDDDCGLGSTCGGTCSGLQACAYAANTVECGACSVCDGQGGCEPLAPNEKGGCGPCQSCDGAGACAPSNQGGQDAGCDALCESCDGGTCSGHLWVCTAAPWRGPLTPGVAEVDRPGLRAMHAMAYDSAREVVVLFGGSDGNDLHDDVWEWDGNEWDGPFAPGVSGVDRPLPLADHAMAYDSDRGVCVVFGGAVAGGVAREEVWEWNGTAWAGPYAPGAAGIDHPSARFDHAMAYDSTRGVVVVFGGRNGSAYSNQVWEWDGSAWDGPFTPSQPGEGPLTLGGSGIAYDSNRQVTVQFGGGTYDVVLPDEVWEWSGSSWAGPLPPAISGGLRPERVGKLGLAFDSTRNRTILFGGQNVLSRFDQLLEWDGTSWTQPARATRWPAGRAFHAVAYDSARQRLVLFGGYGNTTSDEGLWEWDPAHPLCDSCDPTTCETCCGQACETE